MQIETGCSGEGLMDQLLRHHLQKVKGHIEWESGVEETERVYASSSRECGNHFSLTNGSWSMVSQHSAHRSVLFFGGNGHKQQGLRRV